MFSEFKKKKEKWKIFSSHKALPTTQYSHKIRQISVPLKTVTIWIGPFNNSAYTIRRSRY
jgi:hypothetical protein